MSRGRFCPSSDHDGAIVGATRHIDATLFGVTAQLALCEWCAEARVARLIRAGHRVTVWAVPVETCGAWNDGHDCYLEPGHPGDHLCAGCGDVWNRGPWDDDADEWEHERPAEDERCINRR